MMKTVLFFSLGIFLFSISAFSQSEINQFDAQGKRHGVWKKNYEGSKQLRYEGTFEHGEEVGEFKFYCEDCKDKPSVVKIFSGKDDIADVKFFTAKGKLVSEGKMKGKDRIDEWVYYHQKSNGIMSRENYVGGKLSGQKITYYPNGKITEEVEYADGLMNGED